MLTLTGLHIYPVKSLGGINCQQALVQRRGLQYDRRWMVADPQTGQFVSQREIPKMALLGTAIEPPFLHIFWRDRPSERLSVPLEPSFSELEKVQATVWSQRCAARRVSADADAWLSEMLGQPLSLLQMPDTTRRAADGRYAPSKQYVSFADGFSFLVIGQASLDDLNSRLASPVPMDRFRPNFVFSGGAPFEEDTWSDFTLGNQPFRAVKPCARCVMTTIDQQTADRSAEPLRTLTSFRRSGNKVLFGQNLVWLGEDGADAWVRVGDLLTL